MKPVVEATGGMVVQTDTFLNPVFKESFKRVFAGEAEDGYLAVASNATFEACAAGQGFRAVGYCGVASRAGCA